MKYEVAKWLNTKKMEPVYGITVTVDGKKYNAAQDGEALFFDTEKEAQDFVDQMNSLPRCGICGKPLTEAMPKVEDAECGTCCAEHF
jgi:hypothetical protein